MPPIPSIRTSVTTMSWPHPTKRTNLGTGPDVTRLRLRIRALRDFSAKDAVLPKEKLRDYLLSSTHPEGRGKAHYLLGPGYDARNWRRLVEDLRTQHLTRPAEAGRLSPYGQKYEILGQLTGPNGVTGWVRTIWIVRHGEENPRLVTLIPEEKP